MNLSRRDFAAGSAAFCTALLAGAPVSAGPVPPRANLRKVRLSLGLEKPFSFCHFSDIHLAAATEAELSAAGDAARAFHGRRAGIMNRSAASLAAILALVRERGAFAVNTGDLLDYSSEGALAAAAALRPLDILTTPGNHEATVLDPARKPRGRAMFDELAGRFAAACACRLPVEARKRGGVKFVTLDNAGLSRHRQAEALAALKREFEEGLPTVLCCHIPLYDAALLAKLRENDRTKSPAAWMMLGEEVEGVGPGPEAKAIVGYLKSCGNLKAVLAGHLHFFWQGTFNGGVPMVVAPAGGSGRALEIELV